MEDAGTDVGGCWGRWKGGKGRRARGEGPAGERGQALAEGQGRSLVFTLARSLFPMFDAFTKVVAQADARGEFINAGQIDALSAMVGDSLKRMDTVNRITSNASSIVTGAARELFAQQPALIAPGGNAYTHRRMAACLRDMEIVLRYITYAVFTGDASVLEDRCLNGLRETYLALGVPGASVAEGIRKMKDAAIAIANDRNGITPGDCSALMSEVGTYFDRAAAAVA